MWVSWQDFGKCFKMRHAHRARRPNALLRGDFNCKFLNKLQGIFGEGTGNVSHFGTRVAFCDSPHALGITASRRQSPFEGGPSSSVSRFQIPEPDFRRKDLSDEDRR